MSWGVATQNGVSVSLASIMSLSCGATEFSPASLFTSGVVGAWYDPSDINNYMAGLGPELVTNGDNETALFSFGSLVNQDTVARASAPDGGFAASFTSSTSSSVAHRSYDNASSLLAEKAYRFTGRVYVPTGGVGTFRLFDNGDGSWFGVAITAKDQWVSFDVVRTGKSSNWSLGIGNNVAEVVTSGQISFWLDNFSVKQVTTIGNATLFQDSAGTTPVTAVEQPVGLMLDKSQGLVLGSEATSGAWLNGYTTTFDTFASTGPSSFTATTTGAKSPRVAVLASLPAAGWYWIEFTATFTGGSFTTSGFSNTGSPYSAAVATTVLPTSGVTFRTLIYTSAAREYLTLTFIASGASTLSVSGVSVKSYAGNHASQATSASRPILRARYNLLTYSEQFDNAAWTKNNSTITANTAVAPDGTTTADTMRCVALGADCWVNQLANPSGVAYTGSCYFKYIDNPWVAFSNSGYFCYFNIQTGTVGTVGNGSATITDVGNGWYRCAWYQTDTTQTGPFRIRMAGANGSATTTPANATVFIWGADLRTGSSAGTYQRIAAATDYDTAGFLPYLAFDGADDRMAATVTSEDYINHTVAFGAAFNALPAAAYVGNIGNSASANSFSYISGQPGTNDWGFSCRNDAGTNFTNYPPGCVIGTQYVLISRFSTSASATRVNATTATGSANSGVITANLFNLGSLTRTTSSGFANERLYSAVFLRESLSTANEAQLATWIAAKSGVTL
jgi:hypothetical protein